MKRIIASAGMVALGVVSVKAVPNAAGPTSDKPWSVSASLRGFYDDNYALAPKGPNRDDSYGFEVNPKVGVSLNSQQTSFGANYSYTMRYFEGRSEKIDHTHEFNLWLNHQFSERYSVDLRDNLIYSEEPTLTQAGSGVIRTDGTVLHNTGGINFNAQITRLFGLVVGYRNELYDYENPIYSAILDRVEHYANLDLTWTVSPQTVFLTGYQFGLGDYDGSPGSKVKNFYAHYLYAGVTHSFSPKLSVTLKAGGRYTEYYNVPTNAGIDNESVGPFVQASMRYSYLPGSYLEAGFVHDRTATDVGALDGDTSLFYATLSHSFTAKLIGTLTGQVQYSEYDFGGGTDGHDWLYSVGAKLEYHFTPNFSADVAYNFDTVDSSAAGREYERNRIFTGVTVSY